MIKVLMLSLLFISIGSFAYAQQVFEKDTFKTSDGELDITFIGHGSLLLNYGGHAVYIDPYGKLGDYSKLPKADLILVTHAHRDHLDPEAINLIRKDDTVMVVAAVCAEEIDDVVVLKNFESTTACGLKIEAVPAYNIVHKRQDGQPYHPKGEGNGYVITFGDKRMYIAGDTENIAEMAELKEIDYAFLPMNLPYTMTPEMAADAARSFRPSILYPYHYGQTDPAKLSALLTDEKDIEVRIRQMQ